MSRYNERYSDFIDVDFKTSIGNIITNIKKSGISYKESDFKHFIKLIEWGHRKPFIYKKFGFSHDTKDDVVFRVSIDVFK